MGFTIDICILLFHKKEITEMCAHVSFISPLEIPNLGEEIDHVFWIKFLKRYVSMKSSITKHHRKLGGGFWKYRDTAR